MRQLKPTQCSQLVVASLYAATPSIVYETRRLIEAPNWTPDGRWLVFNSEGLLYRIAPNGSEGPSLIDTGGLNDLNNDHVISPDGTWIYVSANDGHIYRVSLSDGQTVRVSNDYGPDRDYRYYLHEISPDGEQLAYVRLEVINGRTTTQNLHNCRQGWRGCCLDRWELYCRWAGIQSGRPVDIFQHRSSSQTVRPCSDFPYDAQWGEGGTDYL